VCFVVDLCVLLYCIVVSCVIVWVFVLLLCAGHE